MATFTNQTKHTGAKTTAIKRVSGGYGYAHYGQSSYGQSGAPSNLLKTNRSLIWGIATFPWQATAPWTLNGGVLTYVNKTKN